MTKKLVNLLMLTGILSAAVVGCNSGANGSTNDGTQASTASTNVAAANPETLDSAPVGSIGSILIDLTAATLNEYIDDTVGKAIWNLISDGNVSGNNNAEWTRQALTAISQQLNTVENDLSQQNVILQTTYNTLESAVLGSSNTALSDMNTILIDNNSNTGSWIAKATVGLGQQNVSLAESIFAGYSQGNMSESISVALQNASSSYNTNVVNISNQDSFQQFLTCDENNSVATYDVTNLQATEQEHPQPSLTSNSCAVSNFLNNAINQYTITQPTQGSNVFVTTQGFDQALDLVYLQILDALTQAYATDQVRLYLGLPITNPTGNANIAIPLVVPTNAYDNYAQAESDLTLAYNMRLANLQQLFNSAKGQLFDHFAGSITSSNMTNQCSLNYKTIDALESSQISQSSLDNNNKYSWDGTALRVTCNNQQSESITTTTNIRPLCQQTNGSYNLQSSNGYIRCGAGGQQTGNYGNYSSNNILNYTTEPSNNPNSFITTYNNANSVNDQAYDFGSGMTDTGTGNLDMYFIGAPLVAWQYNGYNNGGGSAVFKNASSSFVDIEASTYLCEDCNGISSQWSYVDDGVHAYLLSAYVPGGNWGAPVIACLPNDSNCVQGYFPNPNHQGEYPSGNQGYGGYNALLFSNGDTITMTQQLGHGNYNIQTFYNGVVSPVTLNNNNPTITFPNVTYGSN